MILSEDVPETRVIAICRCDLQLQSRFEGQIFSPSSRERQSKGKHGLHSGASSSSSFLGYGIAAQCIMRALPLEDSRMAKPKVTHMAYQRYICPSSSVMNGSTSSVVRTRICPFKAFSNDFERLVAKLIVEGGTHRVIKSDETPDSRAVLPY
ncbi:uncharacterized protein BO72DRAFT_459171 [Aspergillus fijiensis CBS 313.89]|uniref:Uncharacterized protein n=1 Tax=Aspergillus fijiensis CBS 313.89 TaxID=1448319 RepID=A0A8G1VXV3_9EURO|nr:uncharacterized protein BO72DRAFT_459171 [Aspergillus fijiensis CBS 313.89]RAK77055.1 hypothetical protein BO72DRAFT_459171 [Aspergillus fijiensis CBS 313.89]